MNCKEEGIISPEMSCVYDNYCVKRQMINICPVLAEQLLLVDEIMKAGKKMGAEGPGPEG